MLSELEKKVGNYIERNRLFESCDRILLAVSGGADSMALLYILCALKAAKAIDCEILCAHINHQLRGSDADSDEDFVITKAAELGLSVTTKRVDVRGFAESNKISIETAARQLRIGILTEIAGMNGCKPVATAHQKNDNAETVLQRLARGTGFRGLAGIWPLRTFGDGFRFVRPLLCVGRDEIIDYLQKQNRQWRTDHTNMDCTFRRNFIRHRLLPVLQQDCASSLVDQLSELSDSARRFYKLICSEADTVWPEIARRIDDKLILDLKIFQTQPQPVKVELIRRSLDSIGCGQKNLTQEHYEKILHLANDNVTGKQIELPGGFIAYREYENLICRVGQTPPKSLLKTQPATIKIPGQTEFGKFLVEATVLEKKKIDLEEFKSSKTDFIEWFDLNKVNPPLTIRFRQPGDRFDPLGVDGEKKVGKFLTTSKVPHDIRQKILIIADAEKIIWLCPVRISERTKVTDNTQKILQLSVADLK